MRRHRRFYSRIVVPILLCAVAIGWTPFLASIAAFKLSPAISSLAIRLGWTTTQISDAQIDVRAAEWFLITPAVLACGLVATLIAVPAARMEQRRPKWERTWRDLWNSTMLGFLPWLMLMIIAESVLVLSGNDAETATMMLAFLFIGPSMNVVLYRLSRGGWRKWQRHRHCGHRPQNPCPSCGYDLRIAHARCPECGQSVQRN